MVYSIRMTTKKDPKKAEHYVNNKEFTLAVSEFNKSCKLAESKGKPHQG